jgi:hypothetical protein
LTVAPTRMMKISESMLDTKRDAIDE